MFLHKAAFIKTLSGNVLLIKILNVRLLPFFVFVTLYEVLK